LHEIFSNFKYEYYRAGEEVFRHGDYGIGKNDKLYVILKG
jgi:hypothetical protein